MGMVGDVGIRSADNAVANLIAEGWDNQTQQ